MGRGKLVWYDPEFNTIRLTGINVISVMNYKSGVYHVKLGVL